ncbi:MAG: energy-coupling factor transporter ATPase [Anaerovoracaceae bacterium]
MKLTVDHLCHVYNPGRPDETKALEDVSFTIEPGEFAGIIGHTGSGKSTLIQHLNGLLKPTSGSITPQPDRQVRSRIGLVFQYPEYQLFEESVAKDVAFGPKNQGLKGEELEQRVREALDMVNLPCDTFGDRSPFELSGGQKRRAAIAGVIAMRPEILILDEPTAGLDPRAHREILEMVKKIRNEWGCSIVLVSHNMDDVAALCDRVLVMDGGKLVLQGTPQEVFLQADALCSMGLDLPSGGRLIREIRKHGILTIDDAIDETAAADAVVKYLRGCCR